MAKIKQWEYDHPSEDIRESERLTEIVLSRSCDLAEAKKNLDSIESCIRQIIHLRKEPRLDRAFRTNRVSFDIFFNGLTRSLRKAQETLVWLENEARP
jgi:hypothetical protein